MAVGFARGHFRAGRVAHLDAAREVRDRRFEFAGSTWRDPGRRLHVADLVQRLLQPRRLHRLAVPAAGALEEGHAAALQCTREDDRRPAVAGTFQRTQHGVHVVAVDLDGLPAEGLETAGQDRGVVAVGCGPRLSQAVHVDDRNQVRQLVERGELRRLPHRALGTLAVAEQAKDARVDAVEPVGKRHAVGRGQALPQRTGRHLDPGVVRRGVALQRAVDAAQAHGVLVDGAGRGQYRPQDGRGVALGQHEAVHVARLGIRGIPAHFVEEQGRHDLGARQAGGGVAGARLGGHAQNLPPQHARHVGELFRVLAPALFIRCREGIVGIDEFHPFLLCGYRGTTLLRAPARHRAWFTIDEKNSCSGGRRAAG